MLFVELARGHCTQIDLPSHCLNRIRSYKNKLVFLPKSDQILVVLFHRVHEPCGTRKSIQTARPSPKLGMPSCLIHVEDSHVGLREIMTGTVKELIQTYMAAFAVGDTATIEHCFHKDAKIVGKHIGQMAIVL